jgi:poly-gamma-glutamate capsule biosynthesis protein CapA/YwtB (metallophosphatase superfamily)
VCTLARRRFLMASAAALGEASLGRLARPVSVLLCGDVMTGRGIDQIMPAPSGPALREPYVKDAREYVRLAELVSGPIGRGVPPAYVWGDALAVLARAAPDARVINLETSVTRSSDYWPGKGIHYRMHPANLPCLTAARIDVCVLANNHTLDFGRRGLLETLDTLAGAGLRTAGAGRTRVEAQAPAVVPLPSDRRLLVWAVAAESSGVPAEWTAGDDQAGLDILEDVSPASAARIVERIRRARRTGDIVMVSIHWGSNWGYDVPSDHVRFAHHLIDGGADVIYGHSSHHPRPIEVYRNRLILYGCGDLLNDYEGIAGYEEFRGDLSLLYLPSFASATGELTALEMVPMRIRRLQLTRASQADAEWLRGTLDRVNRPFGARVQVSDDGSLQLAWV